MPFRFLRGRFPCKVWPDVAVKVPRLRNEFTRQSGEFSTLFVEEILMTQAPSRRRRLLLAVAACVAIAGAMPWLKGTQAQSTLAGGISSSPLVLDPNDQLLLVVNPDNNTLTGFNVGNDNYQKLFEVPTGKEPQSVALSKDKTKAYVANAVDGTVSVHSGSEYGFVKTIRVGTEAWAVALTPNGRCGSVARS